MVTRRRPSHRKSKKTRLPSPAPFEGEEKQVLQVSGEAENQEQPVRDEPVREQPPALTTTMPVAVILEILAREYSRDAQEKPCAAPLQALPKKAGCWNTTVTSGKRRKQTSPETRPTCSLNGVNAWI